MDSDDREAQEWERRLDVLATPVLALAPPPAVVDTNGREILGARRELAAALDPDLRGTLTGAPRVEAW